MLYEERLEAAERRRRDGNEAFAAGELTQALAKYAMVCVRVLGRGFGGLGGRGPA